MDGSKINICGYKSYKCDMSIWLTLVYFVFIMYYQIYFDVYRQSLPVYGKKHPNQHLLQECLHLMNYNFGVKLLELTKARCMDLDLSQSMQLGDNSIRILHLHLCRS